MKFIIGLRSGKTVEVSTEEMQSIEIRLANTGRNFPRVKLKSGKVLFLNHIETIDPEEEGVDYIAEDRAVKPIETDDPDGELEARKQNQRLVEQVIEKANCKHPDELQQVYGTVTKTGVKFFKACTFCGGNRTRYIASKNLSDEELKGALDWETREKMDWDIKE